MATSTVTPRQRAVLAFIRQRTVEGLPRPSYREIADHFGWRSATAAKGHIRALVRKGHLADGTPGQRRAASLSEPLGQMAPLLDRVGGTPVVDLLVPTYMLPERGILFAFQQPDGRLASEGILEGDMIFVGPKDTPARPRYLVVSGGGRPVAVKPPAAKGRPIHGVVVASARSQAAGAIGE